jgi:hypothetical protein
MKRNFFFILLLLLSSTSWALSIISDLDDTIKITESNGEITDVVGEKTFFGVTEFFQSTKEYTDGLHILSASPTFMNSKIRDVLRKNRISFDTLTLRSNLMEDKFNYKFREIKRILLAYPGEFILIGDDLGKDPEVYAAIRQGFPERISGAYIHVVNGRELPPEVTPYWTSYDLFLSEYVEGRMSPGTIEFMAQRFLETSKLELIFPKKAQCPKTASVWEWQFATLFALESQQIAERMISFCRLRQSINYLP